MANHPTDVAPSPDALYHPNAEAIAATQWTAFVAHLEAKTGHRLTLETSLASDQALHRFSVEAPDTFWALALEFFDLDVDGERTPALVGTVCETARFFPNLKLSFTRNLLRARDGAAGESHPREERPAIIAIDESGHRRGWSRAELTAAVLALASSLARRGVGPGDRVVAIAANTAESVIACLATVAVGASWSSVAPNLGLDATLDRFVQLAPKVLFACASYKQQGVLHPVGDRARAVVSAASTIEMVIALDDQAGRFLDSDDGDFPPPHVKLEPLRTLLEEGASGPFRTLDDLPVFPFDHPLYVLFSSGTTGKPKAIVHGAGGTLLEHVKEHRLHSDLRPGETLFFQTAAGWMMWNWLVSALASQVTIVLYEGSVTHPRHDSLWSMIASERIDVFGTSPGYLQYTREAGIEPHELDLGALRAIQSTGSVLSEELFLWTAEHVKRIPIQSISGGTDIIGCFLLGHPNRPVYAGELQTKSLGYDVDVFGPDGKPQVVGSVGELVCKGPFPSRPIGLFGDASGERFHAAYFGQNEGVWTHGDLLEFTARGTARIHGRSDGILNVLGIRIGPAEIYRALAHGVPEVVEAMAVEQVAPREIGGSRLVLLVVLREGATLDAGLTAKIRSELTARCSPAHAPSVIVARGDLPTTHSGKRSERAARDAVNGRSVANLNALRNPESLDGLATHPDLAVDVALPVHAGPSHEVSSEDVLAIWREILGNAEIRSEDSFFHLGGHSLAAVGLLARIERVYGVRLPMSTLLAKAATPARMAALLASEAEHQQTHLVAIRLPEHDTKRPPIFWLPGGGGLSVLAFREVSMRLGEDQPVYGFEAKLTLENAPRSIAEIAKRYVDDLLSAFPNGPYLLFGFSFGSWVAFEMGVELRARGKDVPLLCVFDSPIPVNRSAAERSKILAQRAGYHAKNIVKTPPRKVPAYMRDTASVVGRRVRERLASFGLEVDPRHTTERSPDTVFDELDRRNRAAAADYVRGTFPTFDGKVTAVLATRTSQSAVSPELDDRLTIGKYATRGLEVHRVTGSHLSMLEPPEVDELASVIRGCIDRALGLGSEPKKA